MSGILFSPEQAMLADIATRFFRDKWSVESTREQLTSETGFDRDLWAEMTDAGWLGIAVPEGLGGTGLGAVELVSLVEPMGRCLFASPFLSTQLVIQGLLNAGVGNGAEALRQEWLPRLAEGAIATLAAVDLEGGWALESSVSRAEVSGSKVTLHGAKSFVLDAGEAELFLVTTVLDNEPALIALERSRIPDAALERETVIDETRRSYRLTLDGVEVDDGSLIRGEAALAALRAIGDIALLLVSAESCGGIAGTLEIVVDYLKSRTQFDRKIGSFQALKHPTVDILIGLERSRSHLYHAATVFGEAEAPTALRMLKAEASESFAFAGDRAVQFHGAFGFTYECDAQLFLRRALWCQSQYGDAMHHRKHLADLLLC